MDVWKMAEEAAINACGDGPDSWACRQQLWPRLLGWAEKRRKAQREKSMVMKSRIKDIARASVGLDPEQPTEKAEPKPEPRRFYQGVAARVHGDKPLGVARAYVGKALTPSDVWALTAMGKRAISLSEAARLNGGIYFASELPRLAKSRAGRDRPLL